MDNMDDWCAKVLTSVVGAWDGQCSSSLQFLVRLFVQLSAGSGSVECPRQCEGVCAMLSKHHGMDHEPEHQEVPLIPLADLLAISMIVKSVAQCT